MDSVIFTCFKSTATYVSAAARKLKSNYKIKPAKVPTVATEDNGSDEDVHSLLMDKLSVVETEDKKKGSVKIESIYDNNEKLVQLKFIKNRVIPREVMKTIGLTIPYQKYLNSIVINRGLRMESLYEISKFLPQSNITEIVLDGTFISEANYHTLLTESYLKHLSLAKCTINDDVVKTITDKLKKPWPASKVLSALNLSSNRITDVGAKYLADMLRTNRQLSYLNLADNMITDEGGLRIMDSLDEFPLDAQEIEDSMARYVEYLKQKNDLIDTYIIELQKTKLDRIPKRSKVIKKSKMEVSLQYVYLEKSMVETAADAQIIQEKAEAMAAKHLGLFYDPFAPNNTRTRNGVVYCCGNNTLCYLNVAYNNLTYASVKKLREVLYAQMYLKRFPKGLIKVVIEGNLMPVVCKEFDHILDVYRSQSEIATKRKSTLRAFK